MCNLDNPIFCAAFLFITNSPGVNNAGTVSWGDMPACPPLAKVSILIGFNGDDPTYFNANPSGFSKSLDSKEFTNSGSPDLILDISCPSKAPSLTSPSLPA